ncbi:MAG TPA: polyprenyl synthetase family protein [Chlamydiales bacterium]|nr:polyprenyl synthetase family protein [Chlamydiales bacterium]
MAIEDYRARVETAMGRFIEELGEKNGLRDACEYALMNGGKRLRPILVLMIGEALGKGLDVMPVALSVEFFHTASLIADDLPCMDNDDVRRNRPSLHKAVGESVAILASYALIAEGYGGIYRNGSVKNATVLCLEAATRCAGIRGATNGQFLDLYPPSASLESIQKIIYQKTVTLFEISFVFGWLFGGGEEEKLKQVQMCAYHLGMAFQIADDLLDNLQDAEQESAINIVAACGREKALALFEAEMFAFTASLKELGLWTEPFQEVVEWLWRYSTPEPVRV